MYLILHYLGLDHIGHLTGPNSELVKPKLDEMSRIVERIHSEMRKKAKSLVLVMGDHGMADLGGHGGASEAETTTPVVGLI